MRAATITIGLFLSLAFVVSCNRTSERPSAVRVPSDDAGPAATASPATSPAAATTRATTKADAAPAPHGLQDDQLRALMKLIAARTQRDWPESVPRPLDDQQTGEQALAIEGARKLSAGLAPAAERI